MKNSYTLSIILVVLTLLTWSKLSYADGEWGQHAGRHGTHQYYHYHDHPHWGHHVAAFYPEEYYWVYAGGSRYYYDEGIYYSYVGGDYVVARPPVGAIVSTIPSDFQPVVINGATYYTDNGVYYLHTARGYQVVSPRAVLAQNMVTVYVPNDRGGYVTVVLKRSGSGFKGPEGEFYPVFPEISRLQTIYGG